MIWLIVLCDEVSFRESMFCFPHLVYNIPAHVVGTVGGWGTCYAPSCLWTWKDLKGNTRFGHVGFSVQGCFTANPFTFHLQELIGCLHLAILLHYLTFVMSQRQKLSPEKWVEVQVSWSIRPAPGFIGTTACSSVCTAVYHVGPETCTTQILDFVLILRCKVSDGCLSWCGGILCLILSVLWWVCKMSKLLKCADNPERIECLGWRKHAALRWTNLIS